MSRSAKKTTSTFTVSCGQPGDDGILEAPQLANFFVEHIKVDGKVNNLQETVSVTAADNKVTVTVVGPFSKRYLKYLTKKYLKKQTLRDFMRVVASSKAGYTVKYFKHTLEEDSDDEEED